MRRLLMLIALLALVLNGPGVGLEAGQARPAAPACGMESCSGRSCADPDQDQAVARSLDPAQAAPCAAGSHRCHSGRPAPVPAALAPRLMAWEPGEPGRTAPGPEPVPWPSAAVKAGPRPGPAARGGAVAGSASLPEGFPGVLARTCVLRI